MTFFVTSDNHFFHNNIIKFIPNRNKFLSVEDMNETMIQNWNRVVKKNDVVFNLGDVFLIIKKIMLKIFYQD